MCSSRSLTEHVDDILHGEPHGPRQAPVGGQWPITKNESHRAPLLRPAPHSLGGC